jgi:hypothetical protein
MVRGNTIIERRKREPNSTDSQQPQSHDGANGLASRAARGIRISRDPEEATLGPSYRHGNITGGILLGGDLHDEISHIIIDSVLLARTRHVINLGPALRCEHEGAQAWEAGLVSMVEPESRGSRKPYRLCSSTAES